MAARRSVTKRPGGAAAHRRSASRRGATSRSAPPRARRQTPRARASDATRRARLVLVGAVVVSAVVLVAWFPASSLFHQRSDLASAQAQLDTLHSQDAALAQEKKNLNDSAEIGRIAREQYQLVSPGQQAYEVLPPTGSTASGTPYAGDPGSNGPVTPSAAAELPPGGVTTTTSTPPSPSTTGAPGTGSGGTPATQGGGGLLSRMVRALEFWR